MLFAKKRVIIIVYLYVYFYYSPGKKYHPGTQKERVKYDKKELRIQQGAVRRADGGHGQMPGSY